MSLEFWRDIAIIFLAVEAVVLLVVLLVPFYFAVRGLNAVHVRLPGYFARAQGISHQVRAYSERAGERVSTQVIDVQRRVSKAEATAQALLSDVRRRR